MRLLALMVLACLGLAPLPAWAQTVKVGAVVPLTGRYGAGGAQIRAGYEIAVEQLNAAGGVTVAGKKMPIELILLDDESDATKTVARLETLAAQGVVAYLGGFGSDLHAAAAAVAEKNHIAYLGVAFALNKVHQQGFRYLFSPFWKSPDIGQATQGLLSIIPAADRPKTVAIFQEKTDWGREMATAWTEAAKGGGYQVVVSGEYAPGAKDFSDLILKAKSANADAVFALPTPPDGMTMVKQMKELGYTPKLTLFIRAPDAVIWTKNLGKDGDYMVLAAGWHHAMKGTSVRELNDAHEKKYQRPADPGRGRDPRGLARSRQDPRRHRIHQHEHGHRAGEVPSRRHGHRAAGASPVDQRQAGAGLAQGDRDGPARLSRAALREALTRPPR
jgi:branched-chain amino acid transport system substrate-binding protein